MNPSLHHISQADIDALPTPIAVPANRYKQETDVRIKMALMIDTIETVYKYGSAIVLQVMRKHPDWEVFANPFKRKSIRETMKQPQLGEHVGIIQSVFFHFKDSPLGKPAILEIVTSLSQKFPADDIKRLRNRRKGHGAWPDERIAEKALIDFRKAFERVLDIAKRLNSLFPLYIEPSGVRFMGASPSIASEPLKDDELWKLEIKDASSEWTVVLYPLFLYQRSGSIIYNGEGDGKNSDYGSVTFLDYFSGGDLDLEVLDPIASDFKAAFSTSQTAPSFAEVSFSQNNFTGRAADLMIIEDFVRDERTKVLIVSGERGVGKSTLLAKWRENLNVTGVVFIYHAIEEGSDTAKPFEVAKHLLYQLDSSIRPAFDWSAGDFQTEITRCLSDPALTKRCLILLDGIDECDSYLKNRGSAESLFDWIPSPSTTGQNVRWILGVRFPYAGREEFIRHLKGSVVTKHEMSPFDEDDVAKYLCSSLGAKPVSSRPELLPLVLELTRGLPLELYLFVSAIRAGEAAYTRESILKALSESAGQLQKGIGSLGEKAQRLEEYLRKDEFAREERKLSRTKLSAADYLAKCAAIKTGYHEVGELKFQNLLALLAVANEPLTEGFLIALLEFESGDLPYYLCLVTRYVKEEQAGYCFGLDAYREYILSEKPDWVERIRQQLIEWCLDPANRSHGYTIRHGVTHLLAAYREKPTEENAAQVAGLLTDIGFITTKVRAGLVAELLQDYRSALETLPGGSGNRFLDLEQDDEDRAWVAEARAACLAGKESPYPERGGAKVVSTLKERVALQRAIRKSEREAASEQDHPKITIFDEDTDTDWDDLCVPDSDTGAMSVVPDDIDEPEETDEEKIAMAKKWHDFHSQSAQTDEVRRYDLARSIFREGSMTDRAVAKILKGSSSPRSHSLAGNIEAFEILVQDLWPSIQNEKVDVAALCYNYRQAGLIHEAGENALTRDTHPWIELLQRQGDDVQRFRLGFPSPRGFAWLEIVPFPNFQECLGITCERDRIPKQGNGPSVHHLKCRFDRLDVFTNKVTASCSGEFSEPWSGEIRANKERPEVSPDGRFLRFKEILWELDFADGKASPVEDGMLLDVRATLGEAPKFQRDHKGHTDYREPVFSDDGYLCADATYYAIHFFDVTRSQELHDMGLMDASENFTNKGNGKPGEFFFAGDGNLLVGKNHLAVPILHLVTGELIFLEPRKADAVTTTRDGRILAALFGSEVEVWDTLTKTILKRFSTQASGSGGFRFASSGELLQVHSEIVDLRTGDCPVAFHQSGGGFELVEQSNRYSICEHYAKDHLTDELLAANNGKLAPVTGLGQSWGGTLIYTGEHLFLQHEGGYAVASFALEGLTRYTDLSEYLYGDRPACMVNRPAWTEKDGTMANGIGLLSPILPTHSGKILLAANDGGLGILDLQTSTVHRINRREDLEKLDEMVGERIESRYIPNHWDKQEEERRIRMQAEEGICHEKPDEPRKFEIADALLSDDGAWILTVTSWDALRIWSVETGKCEAVVDLPKAENFYSGFAAKISLSEDGSDCYLCLQDGSIYSLSEWRIRKNSWTKIHHFKVESETECSFKVLGCRSFVHIHGWRAVPTLDRPNSESRVHEIFDFETRTSYPFVPNYRTFDADELQVITPDKQHVLIHSMKEGQENYLRLLRLRDFEEVMRFPLKAGVNAVSNIAPDGRFAVLTDSGDLLRLQLHLG